MNIFTSMVMIYDKDNYWQKKLCNSFDFFFPKKMKKYLPYGTLENIQIYVQYRSPPVPGTHYLPLLSYWLETAVHLHRK